jgi:asparagine synthase (glutamine-hydrolysing)
MSLQFGIWNQGGQAVDEDHFERAKVLLAPYGPDGCGSHCQSNIAIHYHAFYTTKESRREAQPHITRCGSVITWNGRLDNRLELVSQCDDRLGRDATDVEIVGAAYEKWGSACLGKLIGDWALSAWNPIHRSLILAKDPIGTRHLYFTLKKDQLIWSTLLDPLVLLSGGTFALDQEYIAGWLSSFPAAHLTPYVGIHAIPPSSFALFRTGTHTLKKHWDFDPGKTIRYRSDADYEEHFRRVFSESVRRRLRSDNPVLAELSGGMDSSSIVCIADTIIASGSADTPQLNTVSFYDDSEPNWNERPYFTRIEERRGRTGCHIDVSSQELSRVCPEVAGFGASPASFPRTLSKPQQEFVNCVMSQGNRVLLSGVGGDEVTGGVPTPMPEIEDLLIGGHFRLLAHCLKIWALNKRRPWWQLLLQAIGRFLPQSGVCSRNAPRPAAWLQSGFVKHNCLALQGYRTRLKVFGSLPSFQENLLTLDGLRRQLACLPLSLHPIYEKRYPFLDRDLLEFLVSVPREQLVRPNQRRSLMRRALAGIVPDSVLNRKRKAYVARAPMLSVLKAWTELGQTSEHMISSALGIVDPKRFSEILRQTSDGQEVPVVPLTRTFGLESWLRAMKDQTTMSFVSEQRSPHPVQVGSHICLRKSSAS